MADRGGYYTSEHEGRDQFGTKGDFITSPEISQIFGELVGIWLVTEWMAQGRKRQGLELIEVGPGRGTLMDDMLRVCDTPRITPNASKLTMLDNQELQDNGAKHWSHLPCRDESILEGSAEETTLW